MIENFEKDKGKKIITIGGVKYLNQEKNRAVWNERGMCRGRHVFSTGGVPSYSQQ